MWKTGNYEFHNIYYANDVMRIVQTIAAHPTTTISTAVTSPEST